jgi:hypothetical protein
VQIQVETLKELQNAREAPDLLMWKMSNAQQDSNPLYGVHPFVPDKLQRW